MLRLLALCFCFTLSVTAFADSECRALFDKINAEAPGDASSCDVPIKTYALDKCHAPITFNSERPPSHVVLMLDASGSMAGQVKGESKMKIAKREAQRFLSAIQKDVPVGLMVYGHGGNNTKSGKAESCQSHAWAHPVGGNRKDLNKAIKSIKPTGYTPLAGVLNFAEIELKKLNYKAKDVASVPVVYLISDGKETCGGDPVAAAKALHESGVKAAINVIGFDVDDKTRQQLEAILEAGGGKYFPAEDSKALRKQLNAARESALSMNRYNRCVMENKRKVEFAHYKASIAMDRCYKREIKTNRLDAIFKRVKTFDTSAKRDCARDVKQYARLDYTQNLQARVKRAAEINNARDDAIDALYANSMFKGFQKKKIKKQDSKEAKAMIIKNTKAVNTEDFDHIEKHFSCTVSKKIQSFLEQKNGTIESPENGIEITYTTDTGKLIKEGFSVINDTQSIIKKLQFIDYIEDMLEDSNWNKDDVEWDKLMPLMSVNGGSVNLYIALCGTHENKLFVVDNGDYGLGKVEMTFDELLKKIDN